MTATRPKRRDAALWDDILWEPLLTSLERGTVVPIIGPELAVAEVDGKAVQVSNFVARTLAQQLDFQLDHDAEPTLNQIVSLAIRSNFRLDDIYPRVDTILKSARLGPSPLLLQLARITDFKLIITLSYDTLLEQAVASARGVRFERDRNSISYHPQARTYDLPPMLRQPSQPTIFYLLGRHSAMPEFAVSDGDLLEYLFALQSDNAPRNLLELLKSQNLLFLGGAYPDWFLRILLRLTKQKALTQRRDLSGALEILADSFSHKDSNLVGFLSDFSSDTRVFDADAETFINALWRRWSARNSEKSAIPHPPGADRPFVFISYTRADGAAAQQISTMLQARGIATWMDVERLEGAQDFNREIIRHIDRCHLFVPLLSRNTEARRRDTFFRREWDIAEDRRLGNAEGEGFIFPLVVDDLPTEEIVHIPRFWSHRLQICRAPSGELSRRDLERLADLSGTHA